MEVFVEHLYEIVDGFEVGQIVVADVHADAEIQASIATIHYLEITELNKKTERYPMN